MKTFLVIQFNANNSETLSRSAFNETLTYNLKTIDCHTSEKKKLKKKLYGLIHQFH